MRRLAWTATLLSLVCLVLFHVCSGTEKKPLDKKELALLDKLNKSGIIPDVIDKLPGAVMEAVFPSGQVAMGNVFTLDQASRCPSAISFPRQEGAVYTLAMLDADAPTRKFPKFRPVLHWLVVNVDAGNPKAPLNLKRAAVLMKYRGPKPPLGSGPHRYVLLAFQQKEPIPSPTTLMVPFEKRTNYNMTKFMVEHSLSKPVAANYFLTEDSYVDGVTPLLMWTVVVCSVFAGFLARLVFFRD